MKRLISTLVLSAALLTACSQKPVEAVQPATRPAATAAATQKKQATDPITGIAMQPTPESTCFSQIGYDSTARILYVTFRDSGKYYSYSAVPSDVWKTLSEAKSKGGYYNSDIKGFYDCIKLN